MKSEFTAKSERWNAYEARKLKNPSSRKPDGMEQKPRRPKYKKEILLCKCSTSLCAQEGSNHNSSCPIQCCNDEGVRFPWEEKACTCPVCTCKCTFACYTEDMPKVLLNTRLIPRAPGNNEEEQDKTNNQQQFGSFLGNVIANASRASVPVAKQSLQQVNGEVSDKQLQHVQKQAKSAACVDAAYNISRHGPTQLSNINRAWLQEQIGKPTTVVELPSGDKFDTRTIGDKNAHSRNNGLLDISNVDPVDKPNHPGMKSNLKIDYSQVTEKFLGAHDGRNKIQPINLDSNFESGQPASYDLTVGAPDEKPKAVETVNLMNDGAVGSASGDQARFVTPKAHPKARKPVYTKADSMFDRVLKKSRRTLTKIVQERRKADNGEKKAECKKIKHLIKSLEKAQEEGNHVKDVWAVTNNGLDLIKKNTNPPSSQDVMENLAFYYESD